MKLNDERKVLENMLNRSSDEINQNVPVPGQTPELQNPSSFEIDFDDLEKSCSKEARLLVENAVKFILTDNDKQNEYVQSKITNDIFSLSGMLKQLRLNEIAQQALLREIAAGAMHPRMFEVLGQLSKIIGELNKQLLQTVEAIKLSTKDIKKDIKEKQTELMGPQSTDANGILQNNSGNIITMGTKELVKKVKKDKIENRNTFNNISKELMDEDIIEDAQEIKE